MQLAELVYRYNLGPNGGILTALNLFTTKFDQVLSYIEKRATTVESVVSSISRRTILISNADIFSSIRRVRLKSLPGRPRALSLPIL